MDKYPLTVDQQRELADRDGLLKLELFAIVDDCREMDLHCERFDLERQLALVNEMREMVRTGQCVN